jgi:hypothetical protein
LLGDTEILELIRRSVGSVWALELLLLLRRDRDRSWSADDLLRELRASEKLIADNLAALERGGLVRSEEGRFRYAPTSGALDDLCGRLEDEFRVRPVRVINAIVAPPNDSLNKLANAFRLKDDT